MKCDQCKVNYPSGLVQVMYSSLGSFNVCGICALEISNKIHGNNRQKFDGPMAEKMRQKAIKFRQENDIDPNTAL